MLFSPSRRLYQVLKAHFRLRNFFIALLLGSTAASLLQREWDRGTFAALDAPLQAQLLELREDKPSPNGPVFLVECSEADLPQSDRQFTQWPLTTNDWASVVPELAARSPKTVALLPKLPLPADQTPLSPIFEKLNNWLLCTSAEGYAADPQALADTPHQLPEIRTTGDLSQLPEIKALPNYENTNAHAPAWPMELELTENQAGKIQATPEGIFAPALLTCQNRVVPSLLLATLAQFTGVELNQCHAHLGRFLWLGNYRLPLDAQGRLWLPTAAHRQVSSIPLDTFKLDPAMLDKFLPKNSPIRESISTLKDSLTIVGYHETPSRRHETPNRGKLSPAQLMAELSQGLLAGQYFLPAVPWIRWALLACGLLLSWLLYLMRPLLSAVASLSAILGILVFPVMVYLQELAYVSPGPAILLILVLPWLLRLLLGSPNPSNGVSTNTSTNPSVPTAATAAAVALFAVLSTSPQAKGHHQPGVTIEMLTEQIKATPDQAELYFQRGSELLYQRRLDEALADFQKSMEINPEFLPSCRLRAQVMAEKGQTDEALKLITESIQRVAKKAAEEENLAYWLQPCYCQQAALLLLKNDPEKALQALDSAGKLRWSPDLDLYRLRGECLRMLGRNDERIAELKAAYDKTGAILLRNEWLEAQIEGGKHETALPYVLTEMENARLKSSWLIRRGRIYLLQDKKAEALEDLKAAVQELDGRLTMEDPPFILLLDRGLAHALSGNQEAAAKDFARAKDLGARPGEWRLLERHLDKNQKAQPPPPSK